MLPSRRGSLVNSQSHVKPAPGGAPGQRAHGTQSRSSSSIYQLRSGPTVACLFYF